MGLLEAIILSVIAASTPLLLAAAGELVVERSGVLNLGLEGMMIMGAACGFGGALYTDSTLVGAICGVFAGVCMAAIFGFLTLGDLGISRPFCLRSRLVGCELGILEPGVIKEHRDCGCDQYPGS